MTAREVPQRHGAGPELSSARSTARLCSPQFTHGHPPSVATTARNCSPSHVPSPTTNFQPPGAFTQLQTTGALPFNKL
jgi:hypothetical protein